MITIINNILLNNGYKLVDIELTHEIADIYLFCPLELSKREEYFVTIQLYMQSDEAAQDVLKEKAQELFEKISHSGKVDVSFEKNCTMLLCQDDSKISRKTILAIEEDQYDFKKNVIAYSQKELEDIENYLDQQKIQKITNSIINDIINADSGERFLEFKNNHKMSKDHYSLILKVVLKLPFIIYSPQEQKLTNLSDEFESSLSPDQSLIYNRLVNSDIEWNDENIHQQVERIWGDLI